MDGTARWIGNEKSRPRLSGQIDPDGIRKNSHADRLFSRFVFVRELAGRLGYGSYADYAYDVLYYRDYTPAQAERYVERVRTELAARA